jgi:hypothetical protein
MTGAGDHRRSQQAEISRPYQKYHVCSRRHVTSLIRPPRLFLTVQSLLSERHSLAQTTGQAPNAAEVRFIVVYDLLHGYMSKMSPNSSARSARITLRICQTSTTHNMLCHSGASTQPALRWQRFCATQLDSVACPRMTGLKHDAALASLKPLI